MKKLKLDVYKRQALSTDTDQAITNLSFSLFHLNLLLFSVTLEFCQNIAPVSYTHLDVYKRQVQVGQSVALCHRRQLCQTADRDFECKYFLIFYKADVTQGIQLSLIHI